jgi:predicted Rossmann fold nucleotide-binding protein DprA/Smf involved in DNA uptake
LKPVSDKLDKADDVKPSKEPPMTKVFIGGSRAVSRLSEPVLARLDRRTIAKGLSVVIGGANGADKAVQL